MSGKKKPWVKSAFSQMAAAVENNNSLKDEEPEGTPKTRRSLRNSNKTPTAETPKPRRTTRGSNASISAKVTEVIEVKDDDEVEPNNVPIQSNENWIDIFAPSNTDELAVHPKKIEELKKWFQHCEFMSTKKKQPAQLCLITGPSGSGKTAAIKVIAKELKYSLKEWINPVDQEVVIDLGDQPYSEVTFKSSQVEDFKGFLFKASRYKSLFDKNDNKRLLMVEDFPNFLLRDVSSFEEILENYIEYGKSPLVFIVTDAKRRGLNISFNLFTDQIKQKFLINHISFNAVAPTLMQKAMKRFLDLMLEPPHNEMYRPPTTKLTESIIVSAQGDVRNVLINLHFCSLKGAPNLLTKQLESQGTLVEKSSSSTRKKKCTSTLKSVGRDDSLTMMHALGRVFNPKFTDSKKFVHSPEEIAEAFSTEPRNFTELIYANYLPRFRDIESVLLAANGISLSDMILNEYREDSLASIALNVGIRHLMVSNEKPLTGWMPIKGPKRLDPDKSKIPLRALKVLPVPHSISKTLYVLDYKTFVDIIQPEI